MATFTGNPNTNDNFLGSETEDDLFLFTVADLTSGDMVDGRGGSDVLRLTSAGALAATALSQIRSVERLQLHAGGNSVRLLNSMVGSADGDKVAILGGNGNDIVDASALAAPNAIDVTAGSGIDQLTGGAGADTFRFLGSQLTGADIVQGGAGVDSLVITGVASASSLDQVRGVERIYISGGMNLVLADAMAASALGGRLTFFLGDGTAFKTIDGSSLAAARSVHYVIDNGTAVVSGGAGDDSFTVSPEDFFNATLTGNGGNDSLIFSSAGFVFAGAFSSVERIEFHAGGNEFSFASYNNNTLANAMVASAAGHRITFIGKAGNDIVDASVLTGDNAVDITAGGGEDSFSGGAGDDTFRFYANALTNADSIGGGGGVDRLYIQSGGALAASALNNVYGIERIYLSAVGNSITILNDNVGSATGNQLYVLGDIGADTINAFSVNGGNRVYLRGGGGNDILTGGQYTQDTLLGEDGDDSIAWDNNDLLIDGGAGTDTLTSIMGGWFDLSLADQSRLSSSTNDSGTTKGFENVVLTGSALGGFIAGSSGVNRLIGGEGADTIIGRGGADIIGGGGGDDFILYDAQAASIAGGAHNATGLGDTLQLSGAATVDLRNGSDQVSGGGITVGFESVDASTSAQAVTITGSNIALSPGGFSGTLTGGSAADTIRAGSAAALIRGGGGADILKGGAGGDRFIYQTASEFAAGETVDGAGGYDSIEALVSMSFLGNGITNVEQITAFYGSTVTISGANAAKIGTVAGAYNNGTTETFIVQLASGQTTNLGSFVLAGTSQGSDMGDSLTINGTAGNETVELSGSVLTFNGGDGADIVTISQYSNYGVGSTIRGEGGNDRIDYRGSNVAIDGGAGFDTLVVRNGETVDLSNAADQVTGGGVTTNFEHVDGSASTTALTLTGRNDVSSRLTGGSAADTLTAGAAGATLDGNAGANILQGAQGDDLLIWRNAASSYLGGDGVDTLRFAAAGAYTAADFALTTGLETVALANGVNSLTLGEAVLSGMSNNRMTLIGGDDADSIFIGDLDSGTVTVQTGDGEDALDLRIQFSGARFRGDLGLENDRVTLYGSNSAVAGAIDAGEGRDLLLYDYRFGFSATMASNLTGFEDVDLIDPSTPSNQVYDYVFNANDTADLTVYAGAEQRWTINLGDSGQVAQGNRLSDHLNGGDGDDELYGNIGIDWLDGGAGDDYMDGGEGDDFLILRPDDADEYFGGSGYDTLVVQTEQTLILPTTFGDTSIEHIDASAATGAQILWAFDNITIDATGSAFADTYNISHGYIFAGEGADRIAIGSGSSSLTANGQGGADIFEFQAAPIFNIKLDFVSGQDKLEFADNLFAGMSASTFLTQQTVTNGQAVTYTADLLRFGFLATQAQVQSYMNSNGTVDHAFAIDGAGHLYFIDDGAITYLAEGVSSIAMSDFLFT